MVDLAFALDGDDRSRASVLADFLLSQNALDELPAASCQESVDVMVVADPHQRVAPVGQADAGRLPFDDGS